MADCRGRADSTTRGRYGWTAVTDATGGRSDEGADVLDRVAGVTDLLVVALLSVAFLVSAAADATSPRTPGPTLAGALALLRVVLGLFTALFAPGYALLSLLTPRLVGTDALDRWETVVASFLVSLFVLVAQGLSLDASPWGFDPAVVLRSTALVVLVGSGAAAARRVFGSGHATGADRSGPSGAGVSDARSLRSLLDPPTEVDAVLNVVLVVLVVAGATAVVSPSVGDSTPRFTEFAVAPADGPVDTQFPSALGGNGSDRIAVEITNREHATRRYTLVIQVQRAHVGERAVEVLDTRQIGRREVVLSHNETARLPYRVRAGPDRSRCRVAFLLYVGTPPATPTVENAYRELHLWDGPPPPDRETACPSTDAVELVSD